MRGLGPIGLLLLPLAWIGVLAADVAIPVLRGWGRRVARWPPLASLHRRLGRLPIVVALPLFLIPEGFSRLGWVVSAWLVLNGDPWRGLAVYAGSKLFAGSLALWIYVACLPILMRMRAFAALNGLVVKGRLAIQARLRPLRGHRLSLVMAWVRARRAE